MKYEFHTLDVFTQERFGGNPLAVLPDATGLDGEQMQRIAREFNLSETVFVMPPEDPANTANVRIFTPASEIPFAGHPTVGTAWVLAGGEGAISLNLPLRHGAARAGKRTGRARPMNLRRDRPCVRRHRCVASRPAA